MNVKIKTIFAYFTLFFLFPLKAFQAPSLIVEPDMGREPILSAINHASSSIDLVMYGFTDETILSEIIKNKHKGKSVRILLEKYPYKNDQENKATISTLHNKNISLHWANPEYKLTHQKSLIIDHNKVLIGNFNFTHATFKKERNFGVWVDAPDIVSEIESVFNNDWDYQASHVYHPYLVWSPDNSREKLLKFIREASSSINIYAQSISDYKVIGELAHAAEKGIPVTIITSSQKSKKLEYLVQHGVHIHFSKKYYIHAKVIIVDHQRALLGSMNLTKASIDDNRELSVILFDKVIINHLENIFKNDLYETQKNVKSNSKELAKYRDDFEKTRRLIKKWILFNNI